jgi:hypothetical protein
MLDLVEKPLSIAGDFAVDGWTIIDTPPLSDEMLATFDELPRDMHSLQRYRTVRLTQYFAYCEDGEWIFAPLPRRDYVQSAEYIKIPEAGGVKRFREQLVCDPSSLLVAILSALPIDRDELYQINVSQFRVRVDADWKGITVPEGPHRDGHRFSVVGVARRHQVQGGETQIIEPATGEIVYRTTLQNNQAILMNDERWIHYATDIVTADGYDSGYRDIWVIEVDPWAERCYGPLHEQRASVSSIAAE